MPNKNECSNTSMSIDDGTVIIPQKLIEKQHEETPTDMPEATGSNIEINKSDEELEIAFDLDTDEPDEALAELAAALSEFLDESDGQANLAIDYVIGVVESKTKIAKAETVEDFERALIESIVLPVARASQPAPNPNVPISVLMTFDDAMIVSELHHLEESCTLNVDVSLVDFNRMRSYFMYLCRTGIGHEAVDAALRDIALYHEQAENGTLPDIPKVKFGFFKRLKMMKACAKKQMGVLKNLLKQSHNMRDIEIWYSRYMLSAPIEFAKEHGYLEPAKAAAMATDVQVKKDCAQIAQSMGYDCDTWDVDYERVAHAMRTFCVNKTGYSYIENWLFAAISKHENQTGSLL